MAQPNWGGQQRCNSMIFLASTQESLSVMGLIPKSEGLSLIVATSSLTSTPTVRGGGADGDRDVSDKSGEVGTTVLATDKMTEFPPTGHPPKT